MARARPAPVIACAENIVFNSLLHEVPNPAKHTKTGRFESSDKRYILPFSKERDLVEILSFLPKTEDGPDHIPAICVEQSPNRTSLNILLAINKSSPSEGDVILENMRDGYEKIFGVLRKCQYGLLLPYHTYALLLANDTLIVEERDSTESKDEILDSILAMCSGRILYRLRLVSSRKKIRPSIKDILEKAILGIQDINPEKIFRLELATTSNSFIKESRKVIRLVNNWSNHQVQSRVRDLVKGMCQLNKIENLATLLYSIPFGAFEVVRNSTFASSLLNIIGKVSRYEEAAHFLYRNARKFPIVRNMKLVPATLPPEAYIRPSYPEYSPELSATVSRLGLINGQRYNLPQISHFLKPEKKNSPNEQFSRDVKRALEGAKIHAEIQLIAYCEINSPELWPRVIGSSKDACFLCNAFIVEHGKMHTSRTHGRLYTGWRLPVLWQFKDLEQRFNASLIEQAQETIGARVKGQTTIYPQPNESTLLPLSVSATTSTIRKSSIIRKEDTISTSSKTVSATCLCLSSNNLKESCLPLPVSSATPDIGGEHSIIKQEDINSVLKNTAASVTHLCLPSNKNSRELVLPISVSSSTLSTIRQEENTPTPKKATSSISIPLIQESQEPLYKLSTQSESEDMPPISQKSSKDSTIRIHKLSPGESFWGKVSTSRPSPTFTAGSLKVQIEMEKDSNSRPVARSMTYRIERIRLDSKEIGERSLVVDAMGLEEATYDLLKNKSFFIKARGVVLKISTGLSAD
ncbi:hypothetical protein N7456_008456 [Penicillium angulare]|uniref:Uncharacterized protein n=1 Tax=Penicillium angulare TaxID=116970 RepID=A0A9W9FCU2_9EURO|nr:hypothetical protein N7456_008456 [Penicillium angulare]